MLLQSQQLNRCNGQKVHQNLERKSGFFKKCLERFSSKTHDAILQQKLPLFSALACLALLPAYF